MLRRSIPEYEKMRAAVAGLAALYVSPGTSVVDLGCSRGEALAGVRELVQLLPRARGVRYVGAEISGPMLEAARERFRDAPDVHVDRVDLRERFPAFSGRASVVLSVLALQFVPINYRQRIVSEAREALAPGGAFIVVEKVLGRSTALDSAFVETYHAMKREHGYSDEEVVRKAAALEGVLVPLTARWNEDLLEAAGFSAVDCFWRWMNFAGWIAVR